MTGLVERFIGQGILQGVRHAEARVFSQQLAGRFGSPAPEIRQRIETADADTLLRWSERVCIARRKTHCRRIERYKRT